jgi:ElaB/YqjD/DUF883 family membrane-anchored ribosome-binding protein
MSKSTTRSASDTVDPVSKMADDAANGASEQIQSVREHLQDAVAGLQSRVKHLAGAVRRQAVRTDKTIRAKPYHALGIAAGVGIIAGYLISRRRSSSS